MFPIRQPWSYLEYLEFTSKDFKRFKQLPKITTTDIIKMRNALQSLPTARK